MQERQGEKEQKQPDQKKRMGSLKDLHLPVLLGFQKPTHGNKGAGTSLRAAKGPGAR